MYFKVKFPDRVLLFKRSFSSKWNPTITFSIVNFPFKKSSESSKRQEVNAFVVKNFYLEEKKIPWKKLLKMEMKKCNIYLQQTYSNSAFFLNFCLW